MKKHNPMNILQINTFDVRGGAARVAFELHKALRRMGHNSMMLVGTKMSDDPDVVNMYFEKQKYLRTAYKIMHLFTKRMELISGLQYFFVLPDKYFLKTDLIKDADIIHVHNTHGGYLSQWAIRNLSEKKPVIWTLHDMWAITGHCAHSLECEKWKTGCGKCPYLRAYPPVYVDTTHFLWNVKKRAYEKSKLVITVPSKWLMDKLPESILSHIPVYLINNAVDTDTFMSKDKHKTRAKLGLPRDRYILTFIADAGARNPWKGFDYLLKSLSLIKKDYISQLFFVMIGEKRDSIMKETGIDGISVGKVSQPELMAEYYSASDIYLLPSIAENSPLVVLEAMSCGTPVVAFDVGGVSEIIQHKETGYIAKYKDAGDFARGVEWFMSLDNDKYCEISHRCVAVIKERYTLQQQVQKYLSLYEKVIHS